MRQAVHAKMSQLTSFAQSLCYRQTKVLASDQQ